MGTDRSLLFTRMGTKLTGDVVFLCTKCEVNRMIFLVQFAINIPIIFYGLQIVRLTGRVSLASAYLFQIEREKL